MKPWRKVKRKPISSLYFDAIYSAAILSIDDVIKMCFRSSNLVTMSPLSLFNNLCACASFCFLLIAVATDHWLHTTERQELSEVAPGGGVMLSVKLIHSGLWRKCTHYDSTIQNSKSYDDVATVDIFSISGSLSKASAHHVAHNEHTETYHQREHILFTIFRMQTRAPGNAQFGIPTWPFSNDSRVSTRGVWKMVVAFKRQSMRNYMMSLCSDQFIGETPMCCVFAYSDRSVCLSVYRVVYCGQTVHDRLIVYTEVE